MRWSGAVQAQEFAEVKWSLAERIAGAPTDAEIERAFTDGEIIRTHVMRPTWHFVAAEDIRWLLRLTAPRVHQANKYWYKQAGLDAPTLERGHRVFARELAGAEPRTRKELVAALATERIEGDSIRLGYVFGHAELEQLICSGPRRGKQQTYMLLDDRAGFDPGPSRRRRARRAREALLPQPRAGDRARLLLVVGADADPVARDDLAGRAGARGGARRRGGALVLGRRRRGACAQPGAAAADLRRADRRLQGPARRLGRAAAPRGAADPDDRDRRAHRRRLEADPGGATRSRSRRPCSSASRDQREELEPAVARFGEFLELEAELALELAR